MIIPYVSQTLVITAQYLQLANLILQKMPLSVLHSVQQMELRSTALARSTNQFSRRCFNIHQLLH